MKTSEVLLAARELIATPEKWTQGNYAKNAIGAPRGEDDDDAVAWCAMGAIRRACDTRDEITEARRALERITSTRARTVADWNDAPERTHAEVLEALTKAAALAAAEEQSDEPFRSGASNPCPCDLHPDTHKHYLFNC